MFSRDRNETFAELSCGMLGTLATLHRQRRDLDECERVMRVYQRVMTQYRIIVARTKTSKKQQDCCANLFYRYNHIRFNLAVNRHGQNRDLDALRALVGPLLRDLVGHELDSGMSFEEQNYLFMFEGRPRRPFRRADLQRMSNDQLFEVQWRALNMSGALSSADMLTPKQHRLIELKECAHCQSSEKARGDYSLCGGCKKVHYCGAECQRTHWREHKVACKQAAAEKAEEEEAAAAQAAE
jgi:hypothetical protein